MSFVQIFCLCCSAICIILALINIFLIFINAKRYIKAYKFNRFVIMMKVDLLLLYQCEDVESYNYSLAHMHKSSYSFFNGGCYPLNEEQFNFLKEEINK